MATPQNLSLRRCRRDQRVLVINWAVLILIGVLLVGVHQHWDSAGSDSSDDGPTERAGTSLPSMHVWLDQSEASINGLVTARNSIAAAAARRDIAATGAACQRATGAVAHLSTQMPSPEPAMNAMLQQAISSYATGLPYCVAATQTNDGNGLQRAATYISRGDVAMQGVLDVLENESDAQPANLGVLIV